MHILALVPGGISEQILFFPTLETLQQQYPHAAIDVMVEPRATAAYRVCKYAHEILVFDFKDRSGLADYLNLLGIIRDREYEIAVNFTKRWTIDLLLWLNGIPVRIGYASQNSWFPTNSVPLKTEQYATYIYHDLVRGLGINVPCPQLKLSVPKSDIEWAEVEQKRLEIQDSNYILFANEGNNSYPPSQWKQIIADIQQKQPDLPIVYLQISREEDTSTIREIKSVHPEVKIISPPDVGKLAATIAGANLLLSTRSLPIQIAVAVDTYTIALLAAGSETKQLVPADSDRCVSIQSATSQVADIEPAKVLARIWQN